MKATDISSHARPRAKRTLRVRAPAKLNLTLRVLGRRDDGFHELESFMAAVDLCDQLELSCGTDSPWRLTCDDPQVPSDEANLATRAARQLFDESDRPSDRQLHGLHLAIEKRIPVGAGLGGGSSDAASTLAGLNRLLRRDLPIRELAARGARVGSDVPFFLHGSAGIVRGRGERVETLSVQWPGRFLLMCPPLACETARVYSCWQSNRDHQDRPIHPFVGDRPLRAAQLADRLFNDLEEPAFRAYPDLADWHRQLEEVCPVPVRLSGSGSTFYCPADSEQAAKELADSVSKRLGFATFVTRLLSDNNTEGAAS
jgi:4-diphosphocytidyl-2-C-methyl-D-erythritol kinase